MSMLPRKALRSAILQLTPALRAAVVGYYNAAYKYHWQRFTIPCRPPLQRGRNGYPVVNAAYPRYLRATDA